jgi:conjugal transfer pilus assembly protein TraL
MSSVVLEIPRRLNDPPRMFWWEIDVSLLFLAAVLAGMLAGYFVTGCAAGVVLAWAYGKAKSGEHPAYALHLMYWHLPSAVTGLLRTPPSHLREMVG